MKLKDWLSINKDIFARRDINFLINVFMDRKGPEFTGDYTLNASEIDYFSGVKKLYSRGWPIAYILRREQFFGFDFFVRPGVLIPRPETEIITEEALSIVNNNSIGNVLDLCCGTSCIAVVIAKCADKKLSVVASDISRDALAVSRENIDFYKLPVKLVRSDLLSGFEEKSFDLIVTNPPYVETDYIKGSLEFEPKIALDGRKDGFYFIRKILNCAPVYLRNNGYLVMEIGYNHQSLLAEAVKSIGVYDIVKWIKDYSSYTRGVVLKLRKDTA